MDVLVGFRVWGLGFSFALSLESLELLMDVLDALSLSLSLSPSLPPSISLSLSRARTRTLSHTYLTCVCVPPDPPLLFPLFVTPGDSYGGGLRV